MKSKIHESGGGLHYGRYQWNGFWIYHVVSNQAGIEGRRAHPYVSGEIIKLHRMGKPYQNNRKKYD